MSKAIRTFNSLPVALQDLAIELVITRARQDEHANLKDLVEEAVVAAGAALEVGVMPEVAVDPSEFGEDQTAYQQAESAGPNPDYKDPEIFDPKNQDDAIDALSYLFTVLREAAIPEKHCGRPDCQACNHLFGELKASEPANKMRFQQVDRKEGLFGPVDIYRSSVNPLVYAIMNRGKTALVESSNIELMSYQAAVGIVRVHGKADRSIVD